MKRYAMATISCDRDKVEAYMPGNYRVIWTGEHPDYADRGWKAAVIAGKDSAGWTLDGYVIPRLASGMIAATEIDLSHPIMKLVPDPPRFRRGQIVADPEGCLGRVVVQDQLDVTVAIALGGRGLQETTLEAYDLRAATAEEIEQFERCYINN
jgi:hypothetical protein